MPKYDENCSGIERLCVVSMVVVNIINHVHHGPLHTNGSSCSCARQAQYLHCWSGVQAFVFSLRA